MPPNVPMTSSSKGTKKKSACADCGQETWHTVHCTLTRGGSEPEADGYYWNETSYFLECSGCGATSVRKVRDDASMVDPSEAEVKLFPPAMSRRKPKWFWDIDSRFSVLFNEIYAALDAGSSALPVMGARTILDMVIQDQVGDQGTFKLGLDALANKGLLSKHDRSLLEAAIEAGNAAAHRGFTPTAEDVVRVIEIVEHLVCSLYVLKAAAKGLKRVTPKRRRARKRQAAVAPKTSTPP